MKVTIYSEDFRDGKEVDWPAIPREGDFVTFHHKGGNTKQKVVEVDWHVDTEGEPIEVLVSLSY